jgi:putative transposase
VKYAWILTQTRSHATRHLCRALAVSISGFYAWRTRQPSARTRDNQRLAVLIERVHREFREAYGTERLWRELRDRGEQCGRHRVARLRRCHAITTKRRRRFLRTRAPYQLTSPAPNCLSWPFCSPGRDRIWAGDMTHIPTRRGWLYLAVILDLYSRRVIGWAMADRQRQDLTSTALSMAIARRSPTPGIIHHSDRGSQYTSQAYRDQLTCHGFLISMSRVGMPYDNAVVESFFSSLKNELTHHEQFADTHEARGKVFDYIEVFYNRQRKHQSLNYCSPEQFEIQQECA